ncbi:hypothetical protein MHBO_000541 [Bonamia ostreae]|uniref:Uncharacterized protein n=1 Tax=Bonamia ostreae TaxID=126728 RepID=A0ABV2AGJ8_9EUKA
MSIPQTILIREEAKYSFSPANKSGPALKPFLEGQTTRKIVLSRDSSLIGVIDNFSIYIYKSATFEKIYSFKLVTAERCEKIESDNKKLEEMITKIQLNNSPNTDAIMYKRRIEREYIQEIDISPNNRFLVSLNKFQNAEEPNLTIRDIVHDKIIFALIMKNFNTENWPFFKWLDFEGKSIFCYNEKNKLLFFNADDAPEKTTIFEPFLVFDASATEGESANKNTSFLLKSFSMSASNGRIALFLKSKNKECLSKVTVYNFPKFCYFIFKVFRDRLEAKDCQLEALSLVGKKMGILY